ncbi:MAG: ADP-forming succinate--CoA ligase subunit beta [Actinomycetales bacterium]|nr:ADP-forming succinate--CoA ligase subunit beta [Actinomycetales bacterium]
MDLYEYQARELFAAYGIPVPDAAVVRTPEDARAAARTLGGGTVAVKAQVKTGGRGKAGGIRLAANPAEAEERAAEIFDLEIRGHSVCSVMVARGVSIAREYYLSVLLDRGTGDYLVMLSAEGGVDIERLAAERPEALTRASVDPIDGLDAERSREIVEQAGLPAEARDGAADVLLRVWDLFVAEDATLVEINPLVSTGTGQVLALDAKVTLDDNARFRHPEHDALVDPCDVDPLEQKARARGLNYVKLDGQVGVIGNGAGLVMSTLDVVAWEGRRFGVRPANFLDIGGGASAEVMANALEIILEDPQVEVVLVNVFGGITACDLVANGILHAFTLLAERGTPITRPLVVRLDGNNADLGQEILDHLASTVTPGLIERVETMDGAARRAARLAAGDAAAGVDEDPPPGERDVVAAGEGWEI